MERYMDTLFKDEIVLMTRSGACSPRLNGLMRRDETAVVLPPQAKQQLVKAHKLRHYKNALDVREYTIEKCYRDMRRPIGKWLIKPIVCELSNTKNN